MDATLARSSLSDSDGAKRPPSRPSCTVPQLARRPFQPSSQPTEHIKYPPKLTLHNNSKRERTNNATPPFSRLPAALSPFLCPFLFPSPPFPTPGLLCTSALRRLKSPISVFSRGGLLVCATKLQLPPPFACTLCSPPFFLPVAHFLPPHMVRRRQPFLRVLFFLPAA